MIRHPWSMRGRSMPTVEELESRNLPSVNLITGLQGMNSNDPLFPLEPPDPIIAAGPNQVVELINTTMRVFDKAGNVLMTQQLQNLFTPLQPQEMSDPNVMFDPSIPNATGPSGRFIIGILDFQATSFGTQSSNFDIAVSKDANPLDGFTEMHKINMGEGQNLFADYPRMGMNADAYVYTFNMFDPTMTSFEHVQVLSVAKSSVVDNNNTTLTFFHEDAPRTSDFTLTPAIMHGAASGGPMYFVEGANEGGQGNTINVVTMNNVLSSTPQFNYTTLSVNFYNTALRAKDGSGTMATNDTRILSVAWRNGNLVAAQNVGEVIPVGSLASTVVHARWYEISTAGSTPTLLQQGEMQDGNYGSTYFPAIDIDANNDLGMTYMQSSPTEYVSMYVTGRTPTDPLNTMETPVLVVAGQTTYLGQRAGDFSGMSVDPSTGTSFWGTTEIVPSSPYWGTGIANFSLGTSTPPPPSNSLHFAVTAPASATAGQSFSITVTAENSSNQIVPTYTGTVHFTSSDSNAVLPANYTFTGTDQGKHTFTVTLKTAGTQSVTATDTVDSSITGSASIAVVAASPAKLVFGQQPTNALAGAIITPAVTVSLVDAYGNPVTNDNTDQVSIAIGNNPGGGTLSGTTTVTVRSGVATFSNLSINKPGVGYTLVATLVNHTNVTATSAPFNITASTGNTFNSTDVPAPILGGYMTFSSLFISSPIVISHLTVQLNITYPLDDDLVLELMSPAGDVIDLSDFEGTGANFQNTIFDDNATTPISLGNSPFVGSYKPETPLGVVNGELASGTWYLIVQDWGFYRGTLNSWSLTIQGQSAFVANNFFTSSGSNRSLESLNQLLSAPPMFRVIGNEAASFNMFGGTSQSLAAVSESPARGREPQVLDSGSNAFSPRRSTEFNSLLNAVFADMHWFTEQRV
jgi:subtilisin-like proprotein convertase family protein